MSTALLKPISYRREIRDILIVTWTVISNPIIHWILLLMALLFSTIFIGVMGHAFDTVSNLTLMAVVISISIVHVFISNNKHRVLSILFLIILLGQMSLHYIHNIQWLRDERYILRINGKGVTDNNLYFANAFTEDVTWIKKTYTLSFTVIGETREGAKVKANVSIDLKHSADPNQWRSESEIEKDGTVAAVIQQKFATAIKDTSIAQINTSQLELAFALTNKEIPLPPVVRWNGEVTISNLGIIAYTD